MLTRGYLLIVAFVLTRSASPANIPTDTNILNASTSEETLAAAEEIADFALRFNRPSSSDDDYESLPPACRSSMQRINPNKLMRDRGYDIADSDTFSQVIEVNVCESVGAECNAFPASIFKRSICRQRTMKISLRVTLKSARSFVEDFEIPSQCECATYTRTTHN